MPVSIRFLIFSFVCISQLLANTNPTIIEPNESEIDRFFKQEVGRWLESMRSAKEKCRMKICMKKFKSVGICKGVGTFYLWAKVVAADMSRYC